MDLIIQVLYTSLLYDLISIFYLVSLESNGSIEVEPPCDDITNLDNIEVNLFESEEEEDCETKEKESEEEEDNEMTEEDVIIESLWSALGKEWDDVFSDVPPDTSLHLDTLLWTSFNNMEECAKYPEVMLLDTTHKTNSWGMPFLQVTGPSISVFHFHFHQNFFSRS
jgi:hypothetical protein